MHMRRPKAVQAACTEGKPAAVNFKHDLSMNIFQLFLVRRWGEREASLLSLWRVGRENTTKRN